MKTILNWLKMNLGCKCPKCKKRAVWLNREETMITATFNVYTCRNCKNEFV